MKVIKRVIIVVILLVSLFPCVVDAELSFTFIEDFASIYLTKSGGQIGKGAVNQSMGLVDFNGWYGYGWMNYDLEMEKRTEYDWGAGKYFSVKDFIVY